MLEKFAVKVIGIQRCEVCIPGQGSCINVQCKLAVKLMCDKVQPAVNTLQGSQSSWDETCNLEDGREQKKKEKRKKMHCKLFLT